jgi:hypothetical protein
MLTSRPPRIAIIGGCQVVGLAAATKLLVPQAQVSAWHVGLHPEIDDTSLFEALSEFDVIISQVSLYAGHEQLDIEVLRQAGYPVVYLPTIAFTGLHPDCSYVFSGSRVVKGYFSDLHSNIVASAYVLGLPEERASKLFNPFVFAHLGYNHAFELAKTAFLENFARAGYILNDHLDRWTREFGMFMYTMNHPNITVMADLCALALKKADLIGSTEYTNGMLDDYLAREFIWPVYPGVLSKLSYPGSTTFRRSTHDTPPDEQRDISLRAFIFGSYDIYRNVPVDDLRSSNIAKFCDKLDEKVS